MEAARATAAAVKVLECMVADVDYTIDDIIYTRIDGEEEYKQKKAEQSKRLHLLQDYGCKEPSDSRSIRG